MEWQNSVSNIQQWFIIREVTVLLFGGRGRITTNNIEKLIIKAEV